jgi:hypothetical protein
MQEQKCQFCREEKAEISITDSETLQEVLICNLCDEMCWDNEMCWNRQEEKMKET